MTSVATPPKLQFFDNNGNPLAGGKLYSYQAGTTTPLATYTDYTGNTTNPNPVILDSRGEAAVWFGTQQYKLKLTTSADVEIWTVDNLNGPDAVTLAAFASSTGSSLMGFIQSGAGAVTRTAQGKMREWVSPEDFGAVGNSINDDTLHLQAMFSAHTNVRFTDPSKTYKITAPIYLQSNTTILGGGAAVRQYTSDTQMFDIQGKSDITITGLHMVGVGSDLQNPPRGSDSSLAVAVYSNGGENRIKINGNRFTGFTYTTVRAVGITDFEFCDNIVVGPGSPVLTPISTGGCYGVLVNVGTNYARVNNNDISLCAQGIRIEQASYITVANNIIHDIIGQHGIYSGATVNYLTITGNVIGPCTLMGIKCQTENGLTGNRNVSIVGNTVFLVGDQGIAIANGGDIALGVAITQNAAIVGNTIIDANGNGIAVQRLTDGVVSGNSVYNVDDAGVSLDYCNHVRVSDNYLSVMTRTGIRNQNSSTSIYVTDNTIHNPAQGNISGDRSGISFESGDLVTISGNTVTDLSGLMQYGILLGGTITQTSCSVFNNQVFVATDTGIRVKNNTDSMVMYKNNYLNGTIAAAFNEPAIPNITAASTITIPTSWDVVRVGGTPGTTINSIVPNGHAGHIVTIIFAAAFTVNRTSTLVIPTTFSTTDADTLTLACNGSAWYEIARSVN